MNTATEECQVHEELNQEKIQALFKRKEEQQVDAFEEGDYDY